ncbi:hypothetical protein H7J07_04345 [Mycobacterium koreense]|nr:phage/plasmid primase, P4 family [Mycolicibacillus koreensis]MCV7247485.1 hypothetical protein [Mycolicibacillus koreensis]BBY56687.1 hypothetical protein MKOR_39380 [Mycolicibacillus koreensis]
MKLSTDLIRQMDIGSLELRDGDNRLRLDDSPLSAYLAQRLRPRYRYAPGLGWLHYNGRVWRRVPDDRLTTEVQTQFTALFTEEAPHVDGDRRKQIAGLLANHRVRAVKGLLRGLLLEDDSRFDSRDHAHLLNTPNGVVDLRTGELSRHDPDLLLTKITKAAYRPGASHPDWDETLQALPDPEVRTWLQARLGQAITGLPPTDDVLPIWYGDGANGKSTVLAFRFALGSYAGDISERVLTARPSDHPTELTDLKGLRLAVLEELPEGPLSVRRLKAILGTDRMTARRISRDTMTWDPTHTPVVTTNYRPRVVEVDHGTWRRLALVSFPLRYRKPGQPLERDTDRHGSEGLRERIKHGTAQQEAVLAWLVAGAKRVYTETGEQQLPVLPTRVREDTDAWRNDVDLLALFAAEHLVFDPAWAVLSRDLFAEFTRFLEAHGHATWSDQTFTEKLLNHTLAAEHQLTKARVRAKQLSWPRWQKAPEPPAGKAVQVLGVRFRTANDDQEG